MNVGELNKKIVILEINSDFFYTHIFNIWAKKEDKNSRLVFSTLGVAGKESNIFTIRSNKLIKNSNIIQYDNKYYIISSMQQNKPVKNFTTILTTEINIYLLEYLDKDKLLDEYNRPVTSEKIVLFNGFILQKYINQTELNYYNEVQTLLILITDKCLIFDEGKQIKFNDKRYMIKTAHLLGTQFNEYEIVKDDEV